LSSPSAGPPGSPACPEPRVGPKLTWSATIVGAVWAAGMSVAEMERGFRELGQRLYSAEFTQQRKAAFYERRGAAWPEGA